MKLSAQVLAAALLCAGAASAQNAPPAKGRLPAKAPAPQPLRLAPRFAPGQVLRYQIDLRTTTETRHEGLVQDPQAASQLEVSWTALVRLEVLSQQRAPATPAATGRAQRAGMATRMRTTYERSSATVKTDTFDPAAALMEKQYQKLEGNSIEFTVSPDGSVTDVKGLEDVVTDEQAATAARQWVAQLVTGASSPAGGVVPGQHWTAEQPAESAPLAGIVWRTNSTYLRDELCRQPSSLNGAKPVAGESPGERCAVILTRLEMGQPKPLRDPTPADYRKRGLRTGGTWRGSGESLSYVSRRTGWVVSSTQSGTEEMDVIITAVASSSSVHYAGKVRSESHILLLPDAPTSPAH